MDKLIESCSCEETITRQFFFFMSTLGCPSGYAYVIDYMGNKIYYGSISSCHDCLLDLTGSNGGEVNED